MIKAKDFKKVNQTIQDFIEKLTDDLNKIERDFKNVKFPSYPPTYWIKTAETAKELLVKTNLLQRYYEKHRIR